MAIRDTARRPLGPRAQEREAALLDATIELLREIGYERLTMDAVAARARASKATIYRRYSGKAELVVEALGRHLPASVRGSIDTGTLRDDLREYVRRVAVRSTGADGALITSLLFAARTDPHLMRVVQRLWADQEAAAQSLLARARSNGELSPTAGSWALGEVACSVVFTHVLLGGVADDAYLDQTVDKIVLPLLRSGPSPQSPTKDET